MKQVLHIMCVAAVVAALGVGTLSADVGYLDDVLVVSWGNDSSGLVSYTPEGTDFAAVAAGNYSLALKTDGSLVSWGSVNDTPEGTDFAAVAAGLNHSIALKSDGSLVAWGTDNYGLISDTPTGTDFTAVSAYDTNSLALKADGSIVSWGRDNLGQVSDTPEGTGFSAVAAGKWHNIALKTDGSLVSWGSAITPPDGTDFVAVAAGNYSLAIKTDGSLVTWGSITPPDGADFVAAAVGSVGLALKTDGSLVSWGDEKDPQVRDTPVNPYYLDIAVGTSHSVALKARGEYEDLLVNGVGAEALLQRNVTVDGNATIDTTMTLENNPTLRVAGELIITANAAFIGNGAVSCDTVCLQGATFDPRSLSIEPTRVVGSGVFDGPFQGDTITVNSGDLTVGDPNDYAGFRAESSVAVGVHTLTVRSKGFASLGTLTTLDGGLLMATNGVYLPGGASIQGYGLIAARVSAGFGSTIEATGTLSLGDANSYDGFFSDGSLVTGVHAVTINDRNQAVLGSLTQLGTDTADGTIVAANGLLVEFGKNVVGRGIVDTPNDPLVPLMNNGTIIGDSPSNTIELTGHVKGVGMLENVAISGTLSPGFSPVRLRATNLEIAATGELLIELGGLSGGSEYDQLDAVGELHLGGTLRVSLIGGFVPDLGDT
jgi:hypothetical protein